jgi:hypothetical protein
MVTESRQIMNAILASYLRSLLATTITAIFAVGKLPLFFTSEDWLIVANTVWISFIPVLIRLLNPKDTLGEKSE